MIPYWNPEAIRIPLPMFDDPLVFHPFGILVGIGVVAGSWLAQKRAEDTGLSARTTADLGLFVVILGFIMAHEISLFAYFPERVFGDPCGGVDALACPLIDGTSDSYVCSDVEGGGRCNNGSWMHVFYLWNGISSFGGFLGAFIGFILFFRLKKITMIPWLLELTGGKDRPMLKYLDVVAYGFSIGWFFGRMGCFSAHDHIGKPTNSFLGVAFPDGFRAAVPSVEGFGPEGITPRFDLGLMEVIFSLVLFLVYALWANKQKDLRPGWYASVFILAYAPYRFFLDTLRATDLTHGSDTRWLAETFPPGITPGQVGAVLVFGLGVWIWIAGGKRKNDPDYMSGDKFNGTGWAESSKKKGETEAKASTGEGADKASSSKKSKKKNRK